MSILIGSERCKDAHRTRAQANLRKHDLALADRLKATADTALPASIAKVNEQIRKSLGSAR